MDKVVISYFKYFTIILFASATLHAKPIGSCKLTNDILLIVLKTESHPKRKIGYPWLISFNKSYDKKVLHMTSIKNMFIDNRTIDCKNKKNCVSITKALLEMGITNLDLGAFQINSKYHHYAASDYFSIEKSYRIACNLIMQQIDKHGFSLESIARYHSGTPKFNIAYQKALIRNFNKLGFNDEKK